jgi:hypothetical protein
MRKRGMPSLDRTDAVAQAFSGRGSAAPIHVGSDAGQGITGDMMTKGLVIAETIGVEHC